MAEHTHALAAAKLWARHRPHITSVAYGYKYTRGQRTDTIGIVFTVAKKLPRDQIAAHGEAVIPAFIEGFRTDVVEGTFLAFALTQRRRPCPGGFSIGHVRVTAGTLGATVLADVAGLGAAQTSARHLLTNNHVAANSNDAVLGDRILQPGPHDGGDDSDPAFWFARLTEFVTINFIGLPGKKSSGLARAYWSAVTALGNLPARLTRCPFRLQVRPMARQQPTPNLVDAAICRPLRDEDLLDEIHQIGALQGIRDLALGDAVQKSGRTTDHTIGQVDAVDAQVTVNYGAGKQALFDHQVVIRSTGAGEFSAGGDSGSAIVTEDGFLGGLLFAGGGGQTIANRISDVVALLGVRL